MRITQQLSNLNDRLKKKEDMEESNKVLIQTKLVGEELYKKEFIRVNDLLSISKVAHSKYLKKSKKLERKRGTKIESGWCQKKTG